MVSLSRAADHGPMRLPLTLLSLAVMSTAAAAQTVTIDSADCRRLARHVPAPDVAYQPGIDARGLKVTPADLDDGSQLQLGNSITFDAAADLRRFGLPANSPLLEPAVKIGTIRVDPDGRLFLDGRPLGNPERVEV
jgi:hypothetical protein